MSNNYYSFWVIEDGDEIPSSIVAMEGHNELIEEFVYAWKEWNQAYMLYRDNLLSYNESKHFHTKTKEICIRVKNAGFDPLIKKKWIIYKDGTEILRDIDV